MSRIVKAYNYVRATLAIIRLNKNPERTDLVFTLASSLYNLGKFQELHRILHANPKALKVIEEKKLLEGFSLQELAKLPSGTLGHVYAHHMITQNLNPDFYPRPDKITDETYVLLRVRQTHDLWHVVTGFDTSVLGEIGLQSFMLAQIGSPVSILIVGSSILRCLFKNQERLFPLMDVVSKGWGMGREAQVLFPYDWEQAWNKDLNLVRKELDIRPNLT
jgi:ubiquinone biosynthesis protein COQ4